MAKTFEALMKAEQEREKRGKLSSVVRPEPFSSSRRPAKLEASSQISNEFQQIRQNICLIDPEGKVKCLMFSSPTQGEGNSTILINFAVTLASGGEKVLIVDSNLRSPSFHHVFGLERENGLTELILGEKSLSSVKKETQFPNLSVITSGKNHSNPSSLFEFKALDIHIGEMKTEMDWVIFDSPPINSFNDSITLASKVDGVIMVVRAETTRAEVAQKAKQRMQASNARILGVVLNKRQFHIPDWLYKRLW
jgi:capsular exopolysaccharide synthesis family protein